jgi:ribonuclease HI
LFLIQHHLIHAFLKNKINEEFMYHFYIDGSCKFEKNHTRVGFALTDAGGTLIWEGGQDAVMGTKFEDHALVLALQMVEKLKIYPVLIYTDAMSNARYLERRANEDIQRGQKPRELMEAAYTIMQRLGSDKVSVQYLPRRYNFLADNQAQKKQALHNHSLEYIQSCLQSWKANQKSRIHFFAENDVFLKQKSVFNQDIKSAWQMFNQQKKVVHQHVLVFNYTDKHQVIPESFVFNRQNEEKHPITLKLNKPIYNRNTALSYLLDQAFTQLHSMGIENVSLEMSHSSLSRILQAQEVVGEMRYSRYVRIFKQFQRMKEVNFVFSTPQEKQKMGLFQVDKKEFVARKFMSIGRDVLKPFRQANFNRLASGMAYDIVWPNPEQFDWNHFNQKITELLVTKSEQSTENLLKLQMDEVRHIAQEAKQMFKY